MCEACAVDECEATRSSWCEVCVVSVRESFLRVFSASRTRRSRACWRVERDSVMRATASLSGAMLKLLTVWWMSCVMSVLNTCYDQVQLTVAGSSESNILAVCMIS